MDEDYYDDEADMYSGAGSGESHNATNRSKSDPLYLSEVNQRHILRCWVPTASKLSRGKKGTIQRMFTGEPLKNSLTRLSRGLSATLPAMCWSSRPSSTFSTVRVRAAAGCCAMSFGPTRASPTSSSSGSSSSSRSCPGSARR